MCKGRKEKIPGDIKVSISNIVLTQELGHNDHHPTFPDLFLSVEENGGLMIQATNMIIHGGVAFMKGRPVCVS